MILALFLACAHSVSTTAVPPRSTSVPVDWSAPGPLVHEAAVSATWAVPLKGLVDLDDPRAAELERGDHDIVLPVHVLTHPQHGVFVVDTGMPRANNPARGLVAQFAKDIATVEPLADIVERQSAPLAGVLLTHVHVDHILGLPDVPLEIPVYAGPGEHVPNKFTDRLVFPTFARALGDRPLSVWDFEQGIRVGDLPAVDVLGDGSLWALHVPGHTPGSTAYLARTTTGPVLFTGDCSHTWWGWDHDVTPGTYTLDHAQNARSLASLKALAVEHDLRVEVGHELREDRTVSR